MAQVFFFFFFFKFIYGCVGSSFTVRGPYPAAASGGHSSSRCAGPSPSRPLFLRSTGSRRAGSVIVAHRPSRSAACGIFPDQGSNPRPLHWQADPQPPRHQGSPGSGFWYIVCQTALQKTAPVFQCMRMAKASKLTTPLWEQLFYCCVVIPNGHAQNHLGEDGQS